MVRFALVFVFPPRFILPVFVFIGVDIGVDVAIGVAFVITAVLEFAFLIFAFVFTFTAVSPHAVKPATAKASAIVDPIFLIMVSSVSSYSSSGTDHTFECSNTARVFLYKDRGSCLAESDTSFPIWQLLYASQQIE